MRKNRGYNRDEQQPAVRDSTLFVIACEDSKRTPEYFRLFEQMRYPTRLWVDIVEEKVSDEKMRARLNHASSPKDVFKRAQIYIEQEGLSNGDELWFVIDIDKWPKEQVWELIQYCSANNNWHAAISNPCFEVWLHYHKASIISLDETATPEDYKRELNNLEKGGYHCLTFILDAPKAVERAREADSNPGHDMPEIRETKVYKLVDRLLAITGISAFQEFIENKLPELQKEERKGRVKRK